MNEAQIVRNLKKEIAKKLPRAVIFKHADLATAGVPDLSITYHGRTTWVEVKLLKEHETRSSFRKHIDRLQCATARMLEQNGLCYYFIAYPLHDHLHATIFSPAQLDMFVETPVFNIGNMGTRSLFNGFLDHTVSQLVYRIERSGTC